MEACILCTLEAFSIFGGMNLVWDKALYMHTILECDFDPRNMGLKAMEERAHEQARDLC